MADRYLLETSVVDGYQVEDGTGVLLLEVPELGGSVQVPSDHLILRGVLDRIMSRVS